MQDSAGQRYTLHYTTKYYSIRVKSIAMQCSTVHHSEMQYSTLNYSKMQYSTLNYSEIQYKTVHYGALLWLRLGAEHDQHCRPSDIMMDLDRPLQTTDMLDTALYCTKLYCIVLKYTAL